MFRIIISLFIGVVIVGEFVFFSLLLNKSHILFFLPSLFTFIFFSLQHSTSLVTGLRPE